MKNKKVSFLQHEMCILCLKKNAVAKSTVPFCEGLKWGTVPFWQKPFLMLCTYTCLQPPAAADWLHREDTAHKMSKFLDSIIAIR